MNILNDLLMLNRIVIFVKQLVEEDDIDIGFYSSLVKENIDFISNQLDYFYRILNADDFARKKYRTSFCCITKRQIEVIKIILEKKETLENENFNIKTLYAMKNTAREYYEYCISKNYVDRKIDLNNNYVNESEYGFLLNQMSE